MLVAKEAPTTNRHLLSWVDEMARMCKPDRIYWCDGSDEEARLLTEEAVTDGVFIPLDSYSEAVRDIAYWTPMYGVAEIARAPLTHELPWYAVVNAAGWFALFVAGAAWRMSKDTARV